MTQNPSWAEQLLGGDDGFRREAERLAVALGLSSLFGVALGLRGGGAAIGVHALGVTIGLAAVCGLAVPALAIMLALVDASMDALGLARATARAAAHAGLVLAGLAPGAALFAVTVEDALTVTVVGLGGLFLAGAIGMRSFVRELKPHVGAGVLANVAVPSFLVFAAVLCARVWWICLPLVRGVS